MRRLSFRAVATVSTSVLILSGMAATANAQEPDDAHKAAASETAAAFLDGDSAKAASDGKFTALNKVTDGDDTTVRLQQYHHGVKVLGGHTLVHFADGTDAADVTGVTGNLYSRLRVGTDPVLSREQAKLQALSALDNPGTRVAATADKPKLVVLPESGGRLTWQVTVRGTDATTGNPLLREYFVDATGGAIALKYDRLNFAGPVETEGASHAGKTYPLRAFEKDDAKFELRDRSRDMWGSAEGEILTYDAQGRDYTDYLGELPDDTPLVTSEAKVFGGRATEAGAVDAHWGAGEVYEFYKERFGRDGLDGKGASMISVVGVTANGRSFNNAFWDGTKMVYGFASGAYRPFSTDLDVVGHEMTHGVITNSADLIYLHQSGAMNEALADYFGNAIDVTVSGTDMSDPEAGLLAENLCTAKPPKECALRDLNDGRVAAKDYIGATVGSDNGGVHFNSTIFSGAIWDVREKLEPKVADKVVYKALTEYMTPTDDFADGREAIEDAARAMGLSRADREVIAKAFAAHGIHDGWESRIDVDSKALADGVTDRSFSADAGRGRVVFSNSDATGLENPAIYAVGTSGRPRVVRLSDDDGRYNTGPATDGRTAAWTVFDPDTGYAILRARASGHGKPEVIATPGDNSVNVGDVDGDTVAWTEFGPDTGFVTKVKVWRDGEVTDVTPEEGVGGSWISLRGDNLGFVQIKGGSQIDYTPTLFNLKSGKKTSLTTPRLGVYNSSVVVGEKHAYWVQDENVDGKAAIKRAKLDGTGETDLIAESAASAPKFPSMVGTDSGLTFTDTDGSGRYPALKQLSPSDGKVRSMTCNRGQKYSPAADTGRAVAWLDGTAGDSIVMYRTKPVGGC